MVKRMGMIIGLKSEAVIEYKKLHADVWPDILGRLKMSNISNYSIFFREPENLLFSYWEYSGGDFEADMNDIAQDTITQTWWALCGPMQSPLDSRKKGEWWAGMEEVFHFDWAK